VVTAPALDLLDRPSDIFPNSGALGVALGSQVSCTKPCPVMSVFAAFLNNCDGQVTQLVFRLRHPQIRIPLTMCSAKKKNDRPTERAVPVVCYGRAAKFSRGTLTAEFRSMGHINVHFLGGGGSH
jgi:hypothetical protein